MTPSRQRWLACSPTAAGLSPERKVPPSEAVEHHSGISKQPVVPEPRRSIVNRKNLVAFSFWFGNPNDAPTSPSREPIEIVVLARKCFRHHTGKARRF
mgnify:CR=1 FL=1